MRISDWSSDVCSSDLQGNDIKPYTVSDFTIAPGETYDVLVNITENKHYAIYAESIDTVGAAYGALITSPSQQDRKSVVSGKSVSVRVDLGGRRVIKK